MLSYANFSAGHGKVAGGSPPPRAAAPRGAACSPVCPTLVLYFTWRLAINADLR